MRTNRLTAFLSRFRLWFGVFAIVVLTCGAADAANVRARISSTVASVEEDLVFSIEVSGGNPDELPNVPKIDGLEVDFAGRNSSTTIINGDVRQSVTFQYRVTPLKQGALVIPSISVSVKGQQLATDEIKIDVKPAEPAAQAGDMAFGQISVLRKPVYVGEAVQVEIRYFLEQEGSRWDTQNIQPTKAFDGDGYSTSPLTLSGENPTELAGKRYTRLVLRGVVTPNRAGKLSVGPMPIRLPHQRTAGGGSFRMGNVRMATINAPAMELEVLPLPVEGRPPSFNGAIGDFRFTGVGSPDRVKAGEPVTMTLKVSGQGNFERMGPHAASPVLAETDGWRAYTPTDSFEANDRFSILGTKTFQVAVVPQARKTAMPVFEFCFFSPAEGKYLVRRTEPAPLVVEGETTAPVPADGTAAQKPATPDIAGIVATQSFLVPKWRPGPLAVFGFMLAPAPLLLFALWWRSRATDYAALTRARLQKERARMLDRATRSNDRAEVFDAAARILQIDVALATGLPDAGISEAEVMERFGSPEIQRMYEARAGLVYAGGGSGAVNERERDLALSAVEHTNPK